MDKVWYQTTQNKMAVASDKLIVTTEEAELKKKGYALGTTLGEGSYAKVKSAFADKDQKRVAIKIINQKKAPKDFRERFLPRELDILQSIRHENLVNLHEIFRMNGKVNTGAIHESQEPRMQFLMKL